MSTTSKSPRKVLLVAHESARRTLPTYAHRFAPKKFTQPQLFACLVLKAHQKKDYRGLCAMLADSPNLLDAIGMKEVPHYTTLQKAGVRLLSSARVRALLGRTLGLARRGRRVVKHAAADSTGLDTHHASRYFIWRSRGGNAGQNKPKQRVSYRRYGKLMVLACCASHLILAAVASAGPTPDVGELGGLMADLNRDVVIERVVADAGFDSAHNHRLLREEHGILSVIPPDHGRPSTHGRLPTDRYRRLMKRRFNRKAYRKRPQVETVMSMLKRNLGQSLRGRTHHSRRRDMLLMALTHNIAILLPIA
jgi:Transposase DDE domain